jgi:hypothetical protein
MGPSSEWYSFEFRVAFTDCPGSVMNFLGYDYKKHVASPAENGEEDLEEGEE